MIHVLDTDRVTKYITKEIMKYKRRCTDLVYLSFSAAVSRRYCAE
jgi:hypothetical protein